jgi:dTDP-4-dehydrorhamnose reductase
MNRIAIFGANGQLGTRLVQALGDRALPVTRAECDLADSAALALFLHRFSPDAIVNAAAYTNVERAEDEESLAHRINAEAPRVMAEYAAGAGIPFLHVSTDYVFDGAKPSPYTEADRTAPLNAYGRTKESGERFVLATYPAAIVFRVSWLYDVTGKNFLRTMIQKMRQEEILRVVRDQTGAPGFVLDIAAAILAALEACIPGGIWHLAHAGETSWHGFAVAIAEEMHRREVLPLREIQAITSAEFPTRAVRPKNSRLDCDKLAAHGIALPDWREALARCMKELYAD